MGKKDKKQDKIIPQWSLGFILATFGNYFLLALIFILLITSPGRTILSYQSKIAFFSGVFISVIIICSSNLRKFRTILHEMKHAVVVLLTGNRLKKIVSLQIA